MNQSLTRRRLVGLGLAGAATMFAGAGLAWPATETATARLKARPGKPVRKVATGIQPLGLAQGRDGTLSVPPGYSPDQPVPLLIMLHGAGGRSGGFSRLSTEVGKLGIAVVVPDSRGQTWDMVLGGFGPDVAFLDKTLEHAFARLNVDPRRVCLAGYSDGGSYSLSVGLVNGDLFTHVIAFSPGFMETPSRQGKPAIWISHGTRDPVLSIDRTSRRIVPQLKQWGYDVLYKEFEGGHELSPDLGNEAFRWFHG
jgi:phospholipase/carboxylesterase